VERLLVTGVDSMLGANLALALADRCEVLGLYERVAVESPLVRTACWQLDDPAALSALAESWQPNWIVHCGPLALSSWDGQPDPIRARRELPIARQLIDLASQWGAALTVLSTDAVFCGPRMFHDEDSPAMATTPTAELARQVERAFEHSDALVVRTHAYGWSHDLGLPGFAARAFESLTLGRRIVADGRRHATPILATDLAELLWRGHETRLRGLYHLAGVERASTYRFVTELAACLGITFHEDELLCPAEDGAALNETSLSSRRARRTLAWATPMLREGLDRFVEQAHNGWRNAWHVHAGAAHVAHCAA